MEDHSVSGSDVADVEHVQDRGSNIDSVTLARLLEEVRNADEPTSPTAYNRMHNRHNRS